ncbi:KR domain-containing protein [Aspergillus insuetus]
MAGVLVVVVTAVYALHHRARLQRGESILIHSAAGEEKKQYLVDAFGVDAGHIFASHDAGFAVGIRAATNGHGVDVVLNSLVGELLHESWRSCLADWGRFVEIGKRDIIDHGRLDMGCFARGTTFTAFDLKRDSAHCTVITGDVIKYSDVERAVQAAGAIAPLGGVVQAAMGLHESIFKYITHEAWQTGTLAKVQGRWNLHRALSARNKEQGLDFFLLTSSVAGKVGIATEANYFAANNFLDAFAQYRRGPGLKAISLGLGMVSEVGYIGNLLLRKGIRLLLEDEMLLTVDFALAQQLAPTSVHDRDALAQSLILTGLEDTGHGKSNSAEYTAFSQYVSDARLSVLGCALQRRETRFPTATRTPASVIQAALSEQDDEKLRSAVVGVIAQKFCNLILLPVEKLDVDVSMMHYGIDSMLAAELRQYIFSTTAVEVDFLMLMEQKPSVAAVTRKVVDRLLVSAVTEA